MRIPRSWLLEYVPAAPPTPELIPLLTNGIAEVEAVEQVEGDDVLQLELKPDRGDCLSVEGIAREVAALADLEFLERPGQVERLTDLPAGGHGSAAGPAQGGSSPGRAAGSRVVLGVASGVRPPGDISGVAYVHIEVPDLCQRYVACVMDGLRVGPSPDWLQRRIRQVGLRPVNNIVDITNYVLFETGQPLHAFDLDRLEGPSILVRMAAAGESITAINGENYTLTGGQMVIADARRPVAIAGVMGGQETEVTDQTTRILLETARFDPVSVRLTGRALGLRSDSSQRFERGVDPNGCVRAALRAAALIQEIAGRGSQAILDLYPAPFEPRTIRLRPARACRLLGMSLGEDEMAGAMGRLGLAVEWGDGELRVTVPTRRADLSIEEDLIEEVVRIVGYDRVPATLPEGATTPGQVLPGHRVVELVKDALVGSGYTEIRSYSLTNPAAMERARVPGAPVVLRNPTSTDRTILRLALLPSILEAMEANLAHGIRDQHLFEIGRVFRPVDGQPRPEETTHLAGIAMGSAWTSAWNQPPEMARSDFYAVRGALDNMASALRLELDAAPASDHPAMHPGRCALISLAGGPPIGHLGELHPGIVQEYGLLERPVAFELKMEPLIQAHLAAVNRTVSTELPRQPPATRDLAIVVSEDTPFSAIIEAVRNASPLVVDARLFDIYRGPGIEPGEKSIAISLVLRAPERTLTDAEANDAIQQVVDVLANRFGARRR